MPQYAAAPPHSPCSSNLVLSAMIELLGHPATRFAASHRWCPFYVFSVPGNTTVMRQFHDRRPDHGFRLLSAYSLEWDQTLDHHRGRPQFYDAAPAIGILMALEQTR